MIETRSSQVSRKSSLRGKKATFDDYASATWEPWAREPDMEPGELAPKDKTIRSCGVAARMAYAVMLMTRDDLIAMHGKADPADIERMVTDFEWSSRTLKEIATMLDAAHARVLAAAAAATKATQ